MIKKMYFLAICLAFCVLPIYSCQKKKNSFLDIQLTDHEFKCVELSSLASNIEYIPLSKDSLISFIIKVEFDGSNFYIHANNSRLLRFNRNGKFELSIGKKGKGPGEYQLLGDFTIGNKSENIYALTQRNKLFKYNRDGNFIGEINLSSNYSTKIEEHKDTLLVYYNGFHGNNLFNYELINLDGKVIRRFPNIHRFRVGKTTVGFKGECLLYKYRNGIYLKEIYSDTIYCIKGTKEIPHYNFISGKNKLTPEMRENFGGKLKRFKNVILQSNLFETNTFLFYEYYLGGEVHLLTYNKRTFEQYEINNNKGFINDIDGGPNVILQTTIGNNMVLAWYNAYELKDYVASETFRTSTPLYPEKKKALEKLANSLDENDNPVLMLVKLKE